MKLPHIVSAKDFTKAQLDALFEKTAKVKKWVGTSSSNLLMGTTMALLFDQPSLRTSSSFETAMYALGGNCVTYRNASRESSIAKDETLEDTIEMLSGNPAVSVIVLRHPEVGAAEKAANVSSVPVINAGDGLEHPTQALVDLFTIQEALGALNGKRICLVGDPYARTARSLKFALALYKNIRISEVNAWSVSGSLINAAKASDVLYVLRPQQENWHKDIQNATSRAERIKEDLKTYYSSCTVDYVVLAYMSKDSIVLHPRPRGPELPTEVDSDPRVLHVRQGRNGGPVRIALLEMMHSGEWQKLAEQK